jgi:hypothetical protein
LPSGERYRANLVSVTQLSATIRLTSTEITSALGSFLVGKTPTERLLPSGREIRRDSLGLGISNHFAMSL